MPPPPLVPYIPVGYRRTGLPRGGPVQLVPLEWRVHSRLCRRRDPRNLSRSQKAACASAVVAGLASAEQ